MDDIAKIGTLTTDSGSSTIFTGAVPMTTCNPALDSFGIVRAVASSYINIPCSFATLYYLLSSVSSPPAKVFSTFFAFSILIFSAARYALYKYPFFSRSIRFAAG